MAEGYSAAGFDVWVADLDKAALVRCPSDWTTRVVNVAEEDAVSALFGELDQAGGLDVLCANAGIAGPTAKIEKIALADWRQCVSVNLEGAFLTSKYAAPMMKAAGQGAIIFTSSTAGIYGYPNRAPYAAAKWAVIGLMKTVAMELGPFGIRSNAICPGAVEGPRMEGVMEREAAAKGMHRNDIYAGYASGTSMQTLVEARDVADMAVFLGSDVARRVSGQVIAVDGHTENPDPKAT
jgi:NAD(P)-dependent dehydrogenase (short-subunit alcohol dehydrogenase family)